MQNTDALFEALVDIENKYLELSNSLENETNPKKIILINKQISSIQKTVNTFRKYKTKLSTKNEYEEMTHSKNDEYRELAFEYLPKLKKELENLEIDLVRLTIPVDENDSKNVIVEMRSATGGAESSIFVSNLFDSYQRYMIGQGWTVNIMEAKENEFGINYLSFTVEGESVYQKLRFESGVHRVQRVPQTESKGRIHTSTVTVSVLPEQTELEVIINPKDLRIDVYRASGAGGQHVNKTESAVRILHEPSGIIVECQQERSQIMNREHALKMLRAKLWESEEEKRAKEISDSVKENIGRGFRAEKIRTYNFPQNRITDHRVSLTLKKLDMVMSGDFSELHDALLEDHKKKSLSKIA